MSVPLNRGDRVKHDKFGIGEVRYNDHETVGVRFEHGVEECLAKDLKPLTSFTTTLSYPDLDPPAEVIARALGDAIRSVNDAWGVFSRSRIALLPHQLWVCRQVNRDRPARWLVADDVGLGKTIEAGLILMPLISSGEVRRLLVLCPASLVEQWQFRLRTMFDIRLTAYLPEADTPRADFWNTQNQVVASVQTLRADNRGRHQRLEEADPWDMVIVDEAHHLNVDEQAGPTLGYTLVDKLSKAERIRSMVFFSGTPHRGKDHGFLALLKLLRPDLFDTRRSLREQLENLPQVMIRNNKQQVTDLAGNRLFHEPLVHSETYAYSPAESAFYRMLSEFILTGKTYANSLGQKQGRAVMLVLIAMQKLASSSVAAIRRAILGRLGRTIVGRDELQKIHEQLDKYRKEADGNDDEINTLEEREVAISHQLKLMDDELPRLKELLAAADAVTEETKIHKILELVDGPFAGRSVLFFTEYKATQSLLLSRLLQQFGPDSATFINGDERAEEVDDGTGPRTWPESRERAAERFTTGEVRFLVSTEAGGEGIDLQANCFSLIHVDLPWNPMRLHQRVGRLNRYGQTRRVEVFTVRNPDTVEARIWNHLNTKIERITTALQQVMADPEDVLQLVLGMASPSLFRELFATANEVKPEAFDQWFDSRTATLGGQDALTAARSLGMHVTRFDFQRASQLVPRIDLPELEPFFRLMLQINKRKITDFNGLGFLTPEEWSKQPGILKKYEQMVFDRTAKNGDKVLGAGHKLVDQAIAQARGQTASVGAIPAEWLPHPLAVFRITDRVTSGGGVVRAVTAAVDIQATEFVLVRDWELVVRLNTIISGRDPRRFGGRALTDPAEAATKTEDARGWLTTRLADLDLPFQVPEVTLACLLLPGTRSLSDTLTAEE
ncbi:MAG: DEAD/DEAH box helicase family protein [Bacteroidales bacterium]|nr:DEAD/DEAH box helicase family protein [Bacteroidales bacterium]